MENKNYSCPKCSNTQYEVDEMRATGGKWSKIFDVQNKKFTSITCSRCTIPSFIKPKPVQLVIFLIYLQINNGNN